MHFNGQKLSGALEEFSILAYENAKIKFLKKIMVLTAVFLRIKVQVISNPSSQLEKYQTPAFLLMNDL